MFDSLMEDSSGLRKLLDKEASKVIATAPFIDQFKASMSATTAPCKPVEAATKAQPSLADPVTSESVCMPIESPADVFAHLPKAEDFNQKPKALLPESKASTDELSHKSQPAPRRSGRNPIPTSVKLEGIADVDLPPADHSSLFAVCCTLTEASLQTFTT